MQSHYYILEYKFISIITATATIIIATATSITATVSFKIYMTCSTPLSVQKKHFFSIFFINASEFIKKIEKTYFFTKSIASMHCAQ